MNIRGEFDVKLTGEPPFDDVEGVTLSRMGVEKRFRGELDASSRVYMLSVRAEGLESGAYVAVERVNGTLAGRKGTFVMVHLGLAERGQRTLKISIVPDSGTGELRGLRGTMTIEITDGRHYYCLDYCAGE